MGVKGGVMANQNRSIGYHGTVGTLIMEEHYKNTGWDSIWIRNRRGNVILFSSQLYQQNPFLFFTHILLLTLGV